MQVIDDLVFASMAAIRPDKTSRLFLRSELLTCIVSLNCVFFLWNCEKHPYQWRHVWLTVRTVQVQQSDVVSVTTVHWKCSFAVFMGGSDTPLLVSEVQGLFIQCKLFGFDVRSPVLPIFTSLLFHSSLVWLIVPQKISRKIAYLAFLFTTSSQKHLVLALC